MPLELRDSSHANRPLPGVAECAVVHAHRHVVRATLDDRCGMAKACSDMLRTKGGNLQLRLRNLDDRSTPSLRHSDEPSPPTILAQKALSAVASGRQPPTQIGRKALFPRNRPRQRRSGRAAALRLSSGAGSCWPIRTLPAIPQFLCNNPAIATVSLYSRGRQQL
jgi:hypothetical protein